MSAIRLVTFDVTNTIIRVAGGVGQNYAQVAAMYNKKVDPGTLEKAFMSTYKHYNSKYPNFGTHNGLSSNKWWNLMVKDTFLSAGCDDKDLDSIAQHLYVHFATEKGWEVIPGAVSVLTKLKETGVTLGVVSNFDERLERILAQLSLRHYFQFVLTSVEAKCSKPDSNIFKQALQFVDCRPEEGLHIGDNALTDYEGATRAGMKALLYRRQSKSSPEAVNPEHIVHNLTDVVKLL